MEEETSADSDRDEIETSVDSDRDEIPFPPPAIVFGAEEWLPAITEPSVPKPPLSTRSLLLIAMAALVICIACGAGIYLVLGPRNYAGTKTDPVVDAIYVSTVTVTTSGYGDLTPDTPTTKICMAAYILVGVGLMSAFISVIFFGFLSDVEDRILACVCSVELKGYRRRTLKLMLSVILDIVCIATKMVALIILENMSWTNSFYTTVVSAVGVGFGDFYFKGTGGRVFDFIWLIICRHIMDRVYVLIGEMWVGTRHDRLFKVLINQKLTLKARAAMEIGNSGYISTADWILHVLKASKRLEDEEIEQLVKQVKKIDPENTGRVGMHLL